MLDGHTLPQVKSHKHLGLVFNESLKWSIHVTQTVIKAAQRLGLLTRLRKQISGVILRELYTTCVRPVVELRLSCGQVCLN